MSNLLECILKRGDTITVRLIYPNTPFLNIMLPPLPTSHYATSSRPASQYSLDPLYIASKSISCLPTQLLRLSSTIPCSHFPWSHSRNCQSSTKPLSCSCPSFPVTLSHRLFPLLVHRPMSTLPTSSSHLSADLLYLMSLHLSINHSSLFQKLFIKMPYSAILRPSTTHLPSLHQTSMHQSSTLFNS